MNNRPPLFWFSRGTLALVAALWIGDIAQNIDTDGRSLVMLKCLIYVTYACLFFRNVAGFPRQRRSQVWVLLAQIAISAPLESNLSVVTAATIPLVVDRKFWKRWMGATLSVVVIQMLVHNGLRLYRNRAQIPFDITPSSLAIALLSGLLELLAWHLFAFSAAMLIVKFDEDRRGLALLNAEMKGAQVLLMESGRLAERLRISRELHDSLGHHLTGLSLQLEIAEHLPDAQLRPKLAEARYLARLLLTDIREAVSHWRSETSPALPQALQSLSEGMPGLTVKLQMDPELPATAPSITHALFRCAQEALTNSIRHGTASHVDLSLHYSDEKLKLRIVDDGTGCAEIVGGNGLRGMMARMAELGGAVSFESAPGLGFRIEIEVPVPELDLQ